MRKAPNYREQEAERCDGCNNAKWAKAPCMFVVWCNKYNEKTRGYMVCDGWEEEQ